MESRTLISKENSIIRNFLGMAAFIFIVPAAMVLALLTLPFSKPVNRSAQEVLEIFDNFLENEGDPYEWDDFISMKISNSQLEYIRQQAAQIHLPLTEEGSEILDRLRLKAKELI